MYAEQDECAGRRVNVWRAGCVRPWKDERVDGKVSVRRAG